MTKPEAEGAAWLACPKVSDLRPQWLGVESQVPRDVGLSPHGLARHKHTGEARVPRPAVRTRNALAGS